MSMFLEVLVGFRNQWLESHWLRYFRTIDNRGKYNQFTRLNSVQGTRQYGQYTGWEKSATRLRSFKQKELIGQPLVAGSASSQANPAALTYPQVRGYYFNGPNIATFGWESSSLSITTLV